MKSSIIERALKAQQEQKKEVKSVEEIAQKWIKMCDNLQAKRVG